MQADPASLSGQFTQGLLDPSLAVPSNVKGGSAKRYGVYRNNVIVGLVRAMEANFPVVRRLLGEQYFAGFAREFVQRHPPSSPLMFAYGEPFASFLESTEDLTEFPYLGDVARLEQQVRMSHHEADMTCLSSVELAQIPEAELANTVFVPHPATAIISSRYAVHAIYKANLTPELASVNDVSEAQSVLLTRPVYQVLLQTLHSSQLTFMSALLSGANFAAAADAAFEASEEFDLNASIGLMLTSGAFQSIIRG
jgi:hypothetical protein